jgi:hypothetical protein
MLVRMSFPLLGLVARFYSAKRSPCHGLGRHSNAGEYFLA